MIKIRANDGEWGCSRARSEKVGSTISPWNRLGKGTECVRTDCVIRGRRCIGGWSPAGKPILGPLLRITSRIAVERSRRIIYARPPRPKTAAPAAAAAAAVRAAVGVVEGVAEKEDQGVVENLVVVEYLGVVENHGVDDIAK